VSGLTDSVNSLSPSIQVQGPIARSRTSTGGKPFSGILSLPDAIERALEYNLSAVGLAHAVRQARGLQTIARSALLPNVVGYLSETGQQVSLAALGLTPETLGPVSLPEIVGPFNVVDLRARLSQTVVGRTAMNNYRSTQETVRAGEFTARDSRDVIVLAVGGAYLQAIAARARWQSARAQIDTATALHRRALQQHDAGLATPLDVNRAQVQVFAHQQRLSALQADYAKQKIDLARMTGLPPTDRYDLAEDVPFSAAPTLSLEEALTQAADRRLDLKSAEAQVRAAEHALAAARAASLPAVVVSADYGAVHASAAQTRVTFSVAATVRVPLWEGGRTKGEIERANAVLGQRRAELEDVKAQIEGDVRKAYLDLEATSSQMEVTRANARVSTENLGLTRQLFDAGLSDKVAVVQSQQLVAAAELDAINGVFAHNLAKLDLARALGRAGEDIAQFLKLP